MKLRVDYFDNNVYLKKEIINIIEIENKKYLYRFINDINDISEGNILENINFYSKDYQEVNMTNKIRIFLDYFNFDFDAKKIHTLLVKSIVNQIENHQIDEINRYYKKIEKVIRKEIIDYDISLEFTENFDVESIVKLYKPVIKRRESLLDNLFLIIDLEKKFQMNKLLIFVNLKQYLNKEELIEFYKYSLYNNISILLIESQRDENILDYEKKLVIDENLEEFMI